MSNIFRKTKVGTQVSSWQQSSNTVTPNQQTSFFLPHGLTLRHKVGQADITNVTASAGVVTYTAANNYSAGDIVSIYNVTPIAYNLRVATVRSATSTQFTITSAATGTFVSGGIVQKMGYMSVTIPSDITWVYAICVGGGGQGGGYNGGGAGGAAWGWTPAAPFCLSGTVWNNAGFGGGSTRYGLIISGQAGGGSSSVNGYYGGGSSGGVGGSTNMWGMPNAGGAGNSANAISGGGGLNATAILGQTVTAGNGGSGLVGGGGGSTSGAGTCIGGNGGNGVNIITGVSTTGGTGTTGSGAVGAGGGGAGVVTNGGAGSTNNGGLGGGGGGSSGNGWGGDGILYIFY